MHDVVVIGAGIVGLATANAVLTSHPGLDVIVLEKEDAVTRHQSGHNSGVIHSGAYYRPGSQKAELCRRGRRQLMEFCDAHNVSYRICGKLIVATSRSEVGPLRALADRARQNGVEGTSWLGPDEIRAREPSVAGVAALEVPTAGIVDYREVGRALVERIVERGGRVQTRCGVESVGANGPRSVLRTSQGDIETRFFINCAGLHSDRIARQSGLIPSVQIVPFRGEYLRLERLPEPPLTRLIYPVPDPELPFLGVHLTLTLDGRVEAGPNAVLALAREGYRRTAIDLPDLAEAFTFPGFWGMARKHWATGVYENLRSLDRRQFADDLARLVPSIRVGDLTAGGAGVRAQAVGADGRLVDDFVIERTPSSLHVLNAPSPAATSSLAIGSEIASMVRPG